MLNFWRHHFF